ncbi:hypothetical protein MHBO_000529 [Bonamia ostreae]|uniref:Uncharacterized protein n=1 Tax=Bonamia ostreae TaxID=126728 RepID=A0ABV2AGR3_9EUKA
MESKILKNVVQKTKQFESKIGAKNFSDLQKEIKTLFRPETQVAVVGWFELYIEKQLENRFKEFMFKIDHYYSTQYLDYLLNKSKKAILLLNTINQSAEKLYSEFETIFRTYKKVLKQENLYNKNKLFEKIKILHQNYKSQNLIKCLTAVFSATFDIFEENCEDSVLTSQKTKNEFLIKGFAKTTEKLAKLNFNYVLSKSAECFVKETISRKSKIFTEKQKFYLFEDLRILCEDKIFVFLEQISSKELGTVVRKDLILKMGYKEGLKLFFKNLPDIIKAPENTFFIKFKNKF